MPIIRRNSPGARIGITLNLTPTYPATSAPADRAAATRYDGYANRWFLDPLAGRGYPQDMIDLYGPSVAPAISGEDLAAIAAPTDFLGVNYYSPAFIRNEPGNRPLQAGYGPTPDLEQTAMGWAIYPQGLDDLLRRVHQEYSVREMYITENGAAYDDPPPGAAGRVADPDRIRYLAGHLQAAQRAIEAGVPLAGYFVWSLLDNFEWAFGYSRRFGIVHVDFATQRRTIKDSGNWYRQVIGANTILPSPTR